MVFLVLWGKMLFLFPENMILSVGRKMKYDIFFKCSEKTVFSKRIALGYDFSCIIWKDGIFYQKHDVFSLEGGKRRSFSRNSWKYNIFCVHVRVLQTWCHAPLSEKIKNIAKIHLKVIDVLYFYGGPYRRFHTPLSSEKNRKLNIPD